MRDLQCVPTQIDGVEAIDAGVISHRRSPDACVRMGKRYAYAYDDCPGAVGNRAGDGAPAGLRMGELGAQSQCEEDFHP
jgi:hypothetical protein